MLKLGPALLKATNALTRLTNQYSNYWVRHKRNLPIGTDLLADLMNLDGVDVRQIFDVGANRGQTYRRFRSDFPKAMIHCFEPIASPFRELVTVTRDDQNADSEMIAFGNAPGTTEIRLFDDADYLNSLRPEVMNQSPNATTQSVKIETIDRYVANRGIAHIDLLKIDTEGFELTVLEGAHDSLTNERVSLILAEVGFVRNDIRHTNFCDLTDALYKYGFHLYGVYDMYHYRGNAASDNPWLAYANALYVAQRHVAMPSY
jgi:FkbM family methyltransferase